MNGSKVSLNVSTRFAIIVGIIIFAVSCVSAFMLYHYLKARTIKDTHQHCKLVLSLMDSVGFYVRDTLRPALFRTLDSLHSHDSFIAEAMSTTRIRHGIMKYYVDREGMTFVYQRVSDQPRNPDNQATSFHMDIMSFFRQNPDHQSWNGIVKTDDGRKYYYLLKPITITQECLKCHGNPADAPHELIDIYGLEKGFHRKEGELMGVEAVMTDLTSTFAEIGQMAANIFMLGLVLMLCLFAPIEAAFIRIVSKPLKLLSTRFKEIKEGARPLDQPIAITKADEIGQLTDSFNALAIRLSEAHKALKGHSDILNIMINSISDPLALLDTDGKPIVLNMAYQTWLNSQSQGNTPSINTEDEDSPMQRFKTEDIPIHYEWQQKDGRIFASRFYPVKDEEGKLNQIVHYFREITQEKNTQAHIRQTEKLAAIGQMASGLAHEINNPLGIIKCHASLLKKALKHDPQLSSDIAVIEKHTTTCKNIINDLLSFARPENTQRQLKQRANVHQGIENVLAMVQKKFMKGNVQITTDFSRLPMLWLDEAKMKQVYLNLLVNAIQAMPNGGLLHIATLFDETQGVKITFTDTGSGIAPEHLDRIFDPFFTTKALGEGTGLGLFVSYGIIKEHGGDLSVLSQPGNTTFTILLPVDKK